jgi:hypothetical protein
MITATHVASRSTTKNSRKARVAMALAALSVGVGVPAAAASAATSHRASPQLTTLQKGMNF